MKTIRNTLWLAALLALPAAARADVRVELDDGARKVVTLAPTPHFSLGERDSLHALVKPGFRAVFTGKLKVAAAGKYRFSTVESGVTATLSLDGKPLGTDAIDVAPGERALRVEVKRGTGPARFQVIWESAAFAPEPLPSALLVAPAGDAELARWQTIDRGRVLVDDLGCRGCHGPGVQAANALGRGPVLSAVGTRTTAAWIYKWLDDPTAWRSAPRMPKMPLSEAERKDVTAFLASLRSEASAEPPPGERRGGGADLQKRGKALYENSGCLACHGEGAGLVSLKAVGSKMTFAALVSYLQRPHDVDPTNRMPYSVGGRDIFPIAAFLAGGHNPTFEAAAPAGDPARGKAVVASSGCIGCHTIDIKGASLTSTLSAPGWDALGKAPGKGCLAEAPTGRAPRYRLSADDRAAVAAFLAAVPSGATTAPAPAATARHLMDVYRCRACHDTDVPASVSFKDHAPSLVDTGNKLQPSWIKSVLGENRRMRHWLDLKMGNFPAIAEAMSVGFAANAGASLTDDKKAPKPDALTLREGVRYLGRGEEGMACITCHDFGAYKSGAATPAPDMQTMGQRMRHDWFVRWLKDPLRIAPTTQMPAFFTDVEKGLAEKKIGAMWAALSLTKDMPLPEGVTLGPQAVKLPVGKEPVIMRTFVTGAGPRAFVVGLPNGSSYAFDADECRLAYAWQGEFIDVRPSWYERGGQKVTPLGSQFYIAPAGVPFRFGKADGPAPAVRWRGEERERGEPVFRYDLNGIELRDRIGTAEGGGFSRAIEAKAAKDGDLWFIPGPAPGVRVSVDGAAWDGTRAKVALRKGVSTKFTVRFVPEPPPAAAKK